jgi:nitrogen-specific signal transduction histidine kinase/CheY-like chemotaxis protein
VKTGTTSAQLEAEKESVEEKLEQSQNLIMLGRLASGVAHDFNNVLGGILGYAEMLKFRFGKSNSTLERYTDSIIAFSKRAGDLAKEILTFARGSKEKHETINLHRLLTEVQDLLSHSIAKKYQIVTELEADSAVIIGDPGLIQNAIINIVLNAKDAMPQGGEVRMHTENVELNSQALKKFEQKINPGSYVTLSISDNGTGIDDKTLARIFQPFFTTKEKGKGTGLGLPSVLNSVVKHKGAISVTSKVGKGTTFKIYFPLGHPDEIKDLGTAETKYFRGIGTLMIVDDEEALREIIGGMLTDYGYKVSTAADGIEAVEIYKKEGGKFDLVIIDMNLPRSSGRDCFLALKKINPKVKAVISTGFGLNEEAEQVIQEGVSGFIQKPFEMKRLLKLISEVLE